MRTWVCLVLLLAGSGIPDPGFAQTVSWGDVVAGPLVHEDVLGVTFDPVGQTVWVEKRVTTWDLMATCPAVIGADCSGKQTSVVAEVYGIQAGKLALLKTLTGKIIPAQEERIEWPDRKPTPVAQGGR